MSWPAPRAIAWNRSKRPASRRACCPEWMSSMPRAFRDESRSYTTDSMLCTCSTRARARPPRPAPTMAMFTSTEPGPDRRGGDPAGRCGRPGRRVAAQGRRRAGRRPDAAVRLPRNEGGAARPDGRLVAEDPALRRGLAGGAAVTRGSHPAGRPPARTARRPARRTAPARAERAGQAGGRGRRGCAASMRTPSCRWSRPSYSYVIGAVRREIAERRAEQAPEPASLGVPGCRAREGAR